MAAHPWLKKGKEVAQQRWRLVAHLVHHDSGQEEQTWLHPTAHPAEKGALQWAPHFGPNQVGEAHQLEACMAGWSLKARVVVGLGLHQEAVVALTAFQDLTLCLPAAQAKEVARAQQIRWEGTQHCQQIRTQERTPLRYLRR